MIQVIERKRRLCVVTPAHWAASMGGAEYQIQCLLDELVRSDRYEIFYLARKVDSAFKPEGYSVLRVGRRKMLKRVGYAADALSLYRALGAIRPEVIYQRVGCAYTGVAAWYAKRNGANMVWHIAHDDDVTPASMLEGRNSLRRYLEKKGIELGIRQATHIVAQSSDQARLVFEHYGREVSAVIPNFHPYPQEAVEKSGPLTVTWIANVKPWKNPEAYVRLAESLASVRDVRFLVIGGEPGPRRRSWYESVVGAMKRVPSIAYLGPKTQSEVNSILARAHLFVNTSEKEGFPNTFIQAWMREVPVVSLNVNPDNVLEKEGIGYCAGSEERMTEVVRLLLTDSKMRTEYGCRAKQYALKKHSISNVNVLSNLLFSV